MHSEHLQLFCKLLLCHWWGCSGLVSLCGSPLAPPALDAQPALVRVLCLPVGSLTLGFLTVDLLADKPHDQRVDLLLGHLHLVEQLIDVSDGCRRRLRSQLGQAVDLVPVEVVRRSKVEEVLCLGALGEVVEATQRLARRRRWRGWRVVQ